MEYKYNQKLPKEVEDKLDAFLERIKAIKWFQPQAEINKEEVEKEVNFYLSCFGFTAGIEYRELKTEKDWASARASARASAWASARASAWASARAIENILVEDLPDFKEKYPNGTFKNIIPIWEKGLYPIGIIDGKFVIYVPPVKTEFPVIK